MISGRRTVLIDSSAILAALDENDDCHAAARHIADALAAESASIFMTNFIRAEAYTLIGVRSSWSTARSWLRELDIPIEYVTPHDEDQASQLLLRYADKSFSFVDATSFVVMKRLGVNTAFTFDDHFRQYGCTVLGS